MTKFILRLLIIMFCMQSTWAAAAQYCAHELGLDEIAISHTSLEHQAADKTAFEADDPAKSNLDSDCAYCHLGTMKSMLPVHVVDPAATNAPIPSDMTLTYPRTIPRQPERPNWLLAA